MEPVTVLDFKKDENNLEYFKKLIIGVNQEQEQLGYDALLNFKEIPVSQLLPAIKELKERCNIFEMENGLYFTVYREKESDTYTYFHDNGSESGNIDDIVESLEDNLPYLEFK